MMARATARRERSAGVSGHVTSLATRPPHPRPTRRPRSSSSPPPEQPLKRHQASSPTTRCFDLEHDPVDAPPGECSEEDPWGFGCEVVSRFPALGRRSFFCIQWSAPPPPPELVIVSQNGSPTAESPRCASAGTRRRPYTSVPPFLSRRRAAAAAATAASTPAELRLDRRHRLTDLQPLSPSMTFDSSAPMP